MIYFRNKIHQIIDMVSDFSVINNLKTIVLNQSGAPYTKTRLIILIEDFYCFRHKEMPLMGL